MGRAFNVKIDERVKVLMSHLSKLWRIFFFFSNKSLGLIIYKYAQTVQPSWIWVFNGVTFCSDFRSSTDALVMGKGQLMIIWCFQDVKKNFFGQLFFLFLFLDVEEH